ncbi:hypothetical protein ACFL3N_02555, partial [Candidatus Omnitrophota bacterium]
RKEVSRIKAESDRKILDVLEKGKLRLSDQKAMLQSEWGREKDSMQNVYARKAAVLQGELDAVKKLLENEKGAKEQRMSILTARLKQIGSETEQKVAEARKEARADSIKEKKILMAEYDHKLKAAEALYNEKRAALEEKAKRLDAQNKAYIEQISLAKEEIERSVADRRDEIESLRKELNDMGRQNAVLGKQIESERKKVAVAEDDLDKTKVRWRKGFEQQQMELQGKVDAEKKVAELHYEKKSAILEEKIADLQGALERQQIQSDELKARLAKAKENEKQFIGQIKDLKEEKRTAGLDGEKKQDTIDLLSARLTELKETYDERMKNVEGSFEKKLKEKELELADKAIEKEKALLDKYSGKSQSLEQKFAALQIKIDEQEAERKVYLGQLQEDRNKITGLNKQIEELYAQNIRVKESGINGERKIAGLISQGERLKDQLTDQHQRSIEKIAGAVDAERRRLTDQFRQEKSSISQELAKTKAKLKLARGDIDDYMKKLGKYERQATIVSMRAEAKRIEEEAIGYIKADVPDAPLPKGMSVSDGDFTTIGEISSVLFMEDVGRVYVAVAPDNFGLIKEGSRLYVVEDGRPKADLFVVATYPSLNSVIAEFDLEKKSLINEKIPVALFK